MRCLYCGKELALFKRLRGGEFCSDAHRLRYQEEYTQLALNRLLQANAPNEGEKSDKQAGEDRLGESESPALKRRGRPAREDPAREETVPEQPVRKQIVPEPPAPQPLAAPAFAASVTEAAEVSAPVSTATLNTAVLESEPAAEPEIEFQNDESPIQDAVAAEEPEIVEPEIVEPDPAPMVNFLVEYPPPPESEPPAPVVSAAPLAMTAAAALPRLQPYKPDHDAVHLDRADRVTLSLFTVTDFQTPPRERGLELREFVRGVPQVEIHVKPAVESGFEPVKEPFEMVLGGYSPEEVPALWLAPTVDLPVADAEIALGDLARLDFALTDWGGEGAEKIRAEALAENPPAENPQPGNIPAEASQPEAHFEAAEIQQQDSEPVHFEPAQSEPVNSEPVNYEPEPAPDPPEMSVKLEPVRIEPAKHEPVTPVSSRPEPLRFEPVHIDPVFMEKIAGTAGIEHPALPEKPASDATPLAAANQMLEESAPEPEAAVAEPELATAPATITRPLPVTLHGLAPLRGKPVQVFTAATVRPSDLQIPRETGLPLRPVMVLGPAPKPAVEPQAEPAAKSIPIPAKNDAPKPENKPRKAEVRVLPVQLKEVRPEQARNVSIKPEIRREPAKPEQGKPEPREAAKVNEAPAPPKPAAAAKVELPRPGSTKAEPAKAASPKAESARPEPAKVESAKAEPAPVESAKADPIKAEPVRPVQVKAETFKPAEPASSKPAAEEMDSLGLPKLAYEENESFWTKLPGTAKLGVIAGVLALIIGGVVLTSRGSGSAKPVEAVSNEPAMVEEPALGNTAGWAQDWFADRAGAKQGRHVDVLRGSLGLRDYRLLFEGQIEHGAMGWVFRADNKSFYVEKIQVVTPGHDPVVALEHFAVINGVEQQRTQLPIPVQVHLDTVYKVRVDAVGDHFTTWLQDQKIASWTDSQIPLGGVGLYYDANDSFKLRDSLNVLPLRKK